LHTLREEHCAEEGLAPEEREWSNRRLVKITYWGASRLVLLSNY